MRPSREGIGLPPVPRSTPYFETPGASFSPVTRRKEGAPFLRPERQTRKERKWALSLTLLSLFLVGGLMLGVGGVQKKEKLERAGEAGYASLSRALESLERKEFAEAARSFEEAEKIFESAERELGPWKNIARIFVHVPKLSKAATASYALESGKYLSAAGIDLAGTVGVFWDSKNLYEEGDKISILNFLEGTREPLLRSGIALEKAHKALLKVRTEDLPEERRAEFEKVRYQVGTMLGLLANFQEHETLWEELLGGNGPRKYLFLLQNNHELRPTGGFIGSYGLLDVNDGVVRKFFVDGIFNPDGQLKENIVPPRAIQKISAAWSLHDSNWFPDFPKSAEKAIFFYEKTGGPTVDGVITLTPTVMQKLLEVTGPITLLEYGLVVDAENFMAVIQEEVEVNYDKEVNEPKKILADLSVLLLERVFASQNPDDFSRIAEVLVEGLNEKHVLLYMRHAETQDLIERSGWSGKISDTPKDYLSVIHTNINGYKTDGVIDEKIRHEAVIEKDGAITDTVTITRSHRGGGTPYDWWNKVNADYLRVYVPQGSELLSVSGTTWEFPEAPLDYKSLGFREDADIKAEEEGTRIDEKSGTRIYEDAGKTVFASWVYVSPQEEVTVEIKYRLPFRLDLKKLEEGSPDSYAILYQKQPGTPGSALESTLLFPETLEAIWQTGGNLVPYERKLEMNTTLDTDAYAGAVFRLVP